MARKTEVLRFRIYLDEKQAIQDAARLAGVSMSVWARERLTREAADELLSAAEKD